ncbi:MAG: hypothetical protein HQ511_00085 [Rhodospirillales bacterium]|nr:hypothetical protein [Rhodospirillales bacterium]
MSKSSSEMLLLRRTLASNSAFSAYSGVVMIAAAAPLSKLLGLPQTWLLAGLGAGLIVFAAEVYRHSRAARIGGLETRIIIALDVAWVAGSVLLIAAFPDFISVVGRWLITATAIAVAGFAACQFMGLRRGLE